jgi:uncharacterized membrane protein
MKGKMVSFLAMMIALSAVGAAIKIPAIVGSVALDVAPALLAAALLSGGAGALVALFGHLLSALLGGFPLGPLHLLIAGEMAVLVWLFGILYKSHHKILASFLFVLGNSFVAPAPFIFLMNLGFYVAIVPSLFIGSILNTVIALIIIPRISSAVKQVMTKSEVKL